MRKIYSITILTLITLIVFTIFILSTVGLETERFNNFIGQKISDQNENVNLKLEKIKFKFDISKFDLFLGTNNPDLSYKNQKIPIDSIKLYLDFISLIKSKPKINKVELISKEIKVKQFKSILKKIKPSTLNSLIINKVNKGVFIFNLELYFDSNLKIDNFIAKGGVKELNAIITKDLSIKETNFNFFADKTDILIKNFKAQMNGVSIKEGNLQILKDQEINLKSNFTTKINLNKNNFSNYLSLTTKKDLIKNEINLNASVNNLLDITFDRTFKVKNYSYNSKGNIESLLIKPTRSIENSLLEKKIDNLYFKNADFDMTYNSDIKNSFSTSGNYSFDNQNYQKFEFKNDFTNKKNKILLNLDFFEKLNVEFLNYEKKKEKIANINLSLIMENKIFNIK